MQRLLNALRPSALDGVRSCTVLLSSNLVVLYSSRGAGAGAHTHAAGDSLSNMISRGGGPAGSAGDERALELRRAALNNERLASVRT